MVNIGLGISDGVSVVANEEGIPVMLSIETGLMGGVPMVKVAMGASVNPEAMYTMPETFDLYNGGGLDQSFLSGAQIDQFGNVNVSKFSGKYALETEQDVTYISERCVMKLTKEGLMITEIAPGIDLDKDILDKMEFKPIVSKDLKLMDERIFIDEKMNLLDMM